MATGGERAADVSDDTWGVDGSTVTGEIDVEGASTTTGTSPGESATDPGNVEGFSAGPTECLHETSTGPVTVPCTQADAAWSNDRQCYWQLSSHQPAPPFGAEPTGAWYVCIPAGCPSTGCAVDTVWLPSPPPGITVLSPAQAAARLVTTFTLEGISIGMAPRVNPDWGHRRTYVGVPVWMWAGDQTPLNWGTYEVTATLGGQTITASAQVATVQWDMGDGTTVTCGEGTPYATAFGLTSSPSCGHAYSRTSLREPGGMYTVTATSNWEVDWTGGGASGTIPVTTTSTTDLEVLELQSVNVPNPGPNGP